MASQHLVVFVIALNKHKSRECVIEINKPGDERTKIGSLIGDNKFKTMDAMEGWVCYVAASTVGLPETNVPLHLLLNHLNPHRNQTDAIVGNGVICIADIEKNTQLLCAMRKWMTVYDSTAVSSPETSSPGDNMNYLDAYRTMLHSLKSAMMFAYLKQEKKSDDEEEEAVNETTSQRMPTPTHSGLTHQCLGIYLPRDLQFFMKTKRFCKE